MPIPMINITADDKITNFETHFKVSAGPGAGKTRWLINHIKNVLNNSDRLGNNRKVACITYTNVAAETVLERLGNNSDRVEVSTFHSFLYKNVIKPFLFLIPASYELDINRVDGHDEMPIYKGWLFEWKTATGQTYISDDAKIIEAFKDLAWQFNNTGNLILKTKKPYTGRIGNYSIKNDSYIEYKKMYWRKGILDHEDILFFSHILISLNPRVLSVLRAKFPYVFIDEFQDTNPIQTVIVKKIAEIETKVGVIGDIAQSIYQFQGADPSQFRDFTLSEIIHYSIADNHRCTNMITTLLNSIRTDITQNGKRNVEGNPITALVGTKMWALAKAEELAIGDIHSLTRDNITSNIMRDRSNFIATHRKLIEELRETDSNPSRMHTIIACIKATEYAKQHRYKDALKEISKELKKLEGQRDDIQKIALKILKNLLSKYGTYKNGTLLAYKSVIDSIYPNTLSNFRAGAIKTFYESNTYEQLAICVNLKDDTSHHRTIHKAKGAEFENVLLILDKKNRAGTFDEKDDLGFLIAPDLQNNEEHRIRYVGVSRARENLYINVPSLSAASTTKLGTLGFNIVLE
ncbi:MAG: hypothetical protein K0S33_687 [Bacteroidetes bacterium]|jgi:DNA helicase-2/ATP-dependent DNA helicase PcrA|nr:hypothetical protein [Bacteroidota bacterium]